jgi:hypothetical protein
MTGRGPIHAPTILANLIVGLLIAGLTIWWINIAIEDIPDPAATPTHSAVNEDSLPPCPTEDSDGCYWDADTMGNGHGHDVVTLPVPTITDGVNR